MILPVRLNLQTRDPTNEAYFLQILIYRDRRIPRTQECLSGMPVIIHIPMAIVIMCSVINLWLYYHFYLGMRANSVDMVILL